VLAIIQTFDLFQNTFISKYFQNTTYLVSVSFVSSATGKSKCSMGDGSAKHLFIA